MPMYNILDSVAIKKKPGEVPEGFNAITLDIAEIKASKENFYRVEDIQELAAAIEAVGLQEPLVLGRVDGVFKLISGGRRRAAIELLVSEGKMEYKKVKCEYKDMTETMFRLSLLIGNAFTRQLSEYEKAQQAKEFKELLQQAKKEGQEIKGSLRKIVAETMKLSETKVAQIDVINTHATEEVKEQFKEGNMDFTATYNAAQLPEEEQKEIAEQVAAGEDIKAKEIKEQAERKKEQKREEEAAQQNMSDTDTSEEEKENAKKLHVLKMLEKYYIYLNEDDLRTLEAMLEDGKRRKREYGIEDVGQTI